MSIKWKFWQKSPQPLDPNSAKTDKLQKPRELPDRVGRHMVVKMELDPDWVWSLRCVYRKKADQPGMFEIRIVDIHDLAEVGMRQLNYASLDLHPELILYQGAYKKDSDQVHITRGSADQRSTAA
ncbi:hypothetical protein HRM2_02870 [Desulforapulum autotrophicum HRM2]|jgi:hypothetical protein|uniref:Uncharacterized protein n=1 Tax=Desulforapulum autotrophicum (strain ATCC 43914 / DSM 3382 / VKM B-1955 / HRM2) TaxID=177437 RepID=C0QFL3_DESAH|nr:hypothetical protein [Desulforapulum autotrophicum]ACN13409.1 hypothetical protein HRM2_02870 [Desulforapulum autotrophicum HRM2]